MPKYIIVYKGFDGLEQVEGTERYIMPCQAYEKIIELQKKYGKGMKFQICKIFEN